MGLNHPTNPDAENEYESEALSLLSRFSESCLIGCDDLPLQRELALGIVQQTFDFWFGRLSWRINDIEGLTDALLKVYVDSYPKHEQTEQSEVPSTT
jgi:hypothetical protein